MTESATPRESPESDHSHGSRHAVGPLQPARARRSAIEALAAYRSARDPASLAAVFKALADEVPFHWLVTGLLSLSSQLVDYLAVSEEVEADDILRALTSLDLDDDDCEEEPEGLIGKQGNESFPDSDPPPSWAGPDDAAGTPQT